MLARRVVVYELSEGASHRRLGDVLAYRSAFACKDDEPENHAMFTAKRVLEQIIDKFDRGLEFKLYLTGPGNYREALAKEQPYKGNRTQPKPKYLGVIRDYMVQHWQAQVICDREADDALGCAQTDQTCIVTIDKDLNMIPGAHYNPVRNLYYEVDELGGWRFFFTQCLTGDRIDNIKGIDGIGPKRAEALLKDANSRVELERRVINKYVEVYGKQKGMELLGERGSLLWIQRIPGQVWTP